MLHQGCFPSSHNTLMILCFDKTSLFCFLHLLKKKELRIPAPLRRLDCTHLHTRPTCSLSVPLISLVQVPLLSNNANMILVDVALPDQGEFSFSGALQMLHPRSLCFWDPDATGARTAVWLLYCLVLGLSLLLLCLQISACRWRALPSVPLNL